MKKYTTISKIALVICLGLMVLAVINGVTGFINSTISFSGTVICIVGLFYGYICNYNIREGETKKEDR